MTQTQQTWLPLRKPRPSARLRLFCFTHAGGAASVFRTWSEALAPDVEVCALEYPGRWSRHREPLLADARTLAERCVRGVSGLLDRPFALFGYSFGTVIAFEFARTLRREQLRAPEHLIVAASKAPQLPRRQADIHKLPKAGFLEAIDRRYAVLPAAVRNEPELLDMVLPILRADMTALETYVYAEEPPLACPITALRGLEDAMMDDLELLAWGAQTTQPLMSHRLPGGHFFINTATDLVLQLVREALAPARSPAGTGSAG